MLPVASWNSSVPVLALRVHACIFTSRFFFFTKQIQTFAVFSRNTPRYCLCAAHREPRWRAQTTFPAAHHLQPTSLRNRLRSFNVRPFSLQEASGHSSTGRPTDQSSQKDGQRSPASIETTKTPRSRFQKTVFTSFPGNSGGAVLKSKASFFLSAIPPTFPKHFGFSFPSSEDPAFDYRNNMSQTFCLLTDRCQHRTQFPKSDGVPLFQWAFRTSCVLAAPHQRTLYAVRL